MGGRDTRTAGLGDLTRTVGVLFQDPEAQLVMLEVDDEIAFGLENLGIPRHEMGVRVRAARELVGLDAARTPRRLDQLSGGTKQRVVLAALLAMGTAALVLDEPTANLDPQGARLVLGVLGRLCEGRERSLLLVEHRLDEVAGLIDRVAVLDGTGHLALEGPPDAVFGTHAADLDRLGVWMPQFAALARLFEPAPAALPHTAAEAADLLVARWPRAFTVHGSPINAHPAAASLAPVPPASELPADLTPGPSPVGEGERGAPHPRAGVPPSRFGRAGECPPGRRVLAYGGGPGRRGGPHPTTEGRTAGGGALLGVRDVIYRYHRADPLAPPALAHVSLDVRAGEFLALVGPNAAGKSTLGLLLAGVLRPSTGAVLLDGRDLRRVPEREVRARLSYVFQYPEHQFVARTVRDEMLFGLRLRGHPQAAAARRAGEALERFGLAALAAANPYTLSHGQKRRLSVATALVTDPEAIILDEPTFGQDRRHTDELLALLGELHRAGRTVAVITHDLTLVAEHAQRVVALAGGQVAFDGTPRALFEQPEVLARCGLHLPPVAEVVRLARRRRPDLPAAISLPELRQLLPPAR